MGRYPDFIERLLLHEETLHDPLPREPSNWEIVLRIREAGAATVLSGAGPAAAPLLPAVRGGLFYYHNALDDARREFAGGSGEITAYWHGMVHRREGDFENARQWMRRAGVLPVFAGMQARAGDASPHMARSPGWDPFLFIHLCEQFKYGETAYRAEIIHLQKVEFAVLFDYVWRQTAGPKPPARP